MMLTLFVTKFYSRTYGVLTRRQWMLPSGASFLTRWDAYNHPYSVVFHSGIRQLG